MYSQQMPHCNRRGILEDNHLKNKINIKSWIIFFIGTTVTGCGIQLCNLAGLGMDPLGIFQTGMARIFDISLSLSNILICVFFILVATVTNRKDVTFMSAASPFISSFGISIVPEFFAEWNRYVLFPLGLTMMAVGIAVSIYAGCGKTAYDCFIYGFMRMSGKSYALMRFCTDATLAVLGILMKGSAGIGTVIACVCVGKMMEFVLKNLQKYTGNINT